MSSVVSLMVRFMQRNLTEACIWKLNTPTCHLGSQLFVVFHVRFARSMHCAMHQAVLESRHQPARGRTPGLCFAHHQCRDDAFPQTASLGSAVPCRLPSV